LRAEAPGLTRAGVNSFADLYVSRLRYDFDNALNMNLPAMDLYMAPVDALSAMDARAEKFATIPAIRAGTKVVASNVEIEKSGRDLFARYAREWTAFNLIVAAPLAIRSTMAPLSGIATVSVVIEMSAAAN
jgi:hypothetical protein